MGREFELKYAATQQNLEILKERYPHLRPIAMETTYYDNHAGDFSRSAGLSAAGWRTEKVSAP